MTPHMPATLIALLRAARSAVTDVVARTFDTVVGLWRRDRQARLAVAAIGAGAALLIGTPLVALARTGPSTAAPTAPRPLAAGIPSAQHSTDWAGLLSDGLDNYRQRARLTGVSITTLSFTGDVLTSRVTPTGDYDIVSRSKALPRLLRVGKRSYRQLITDPSVGRLASDGSGNVAGSWTTDLDKVRDQAALHAALASPDALLDGLRPHLGEVTGTRQGGGLTVLTGQVAVADVNEVLARYGWAAPLVAGTQNRDASGLVQVQITLDVAGSLERILLLAPDGRTLLMSITGYDPGTLTPPDRAVVVARVR